LAQNKKGKTIKSEYQIDEEERLKILKQMRKKNVEKEEGGSMTKKTRSFSIAFTS